MTKKNLSNDQKIDQILKQVNKLSEIQQGMTKDITSMKGDITSMKEDMTSMKGDITSMKEDMTSMKGDITSMKEDITDLVDMATSTLQLAARTADRVDKIESHLSSKTGFIPFTSGAFTA